MRADKISYQDLIPEKDNEALIPIDWCFNDNEKIAHEIINKQ